MSELPRTCQRSDGQRKLIYPTRGRARAASKRFERALSHPLRLYHCPECSMWHLASHRDELPAAVRSNRLLLIGEAPNRSVGTLPRPSYALTGQSGRRIADLAGVSMTTYLGRTERTDLLEEWPGDAWPVEEARMAALRILPQLAERRTILVGTRVARAFGFIPWDPFPFAIRLDALVPDADVAMMPHPSGRSRWWNDPRNVERARSFLRDTFAPLTSAPRTVETDA